MTKLILITGATGFVGKNFIKQLDTASLKIRLVVREGSKIHFHPSIQIESIIYTKDLFSNSMEWWEEICKEVDIFIHFAWYVNPADYLHSLQNIECLVGTLNIAKACVNAGVKKFIGVGTCFEYELSEGYLSTTTPLNPLTLYAITKVSTYQLLTKIFEIGNVEFIWGRLFYLYGDGESKHRLIGYIHDQLARGEPVNLSHGLQIRDYLDVKDAVAKIAMLMFSEKTGPVNICSGKGVTIRALSESIAESYGMKNLLNFGVVSTKAIDPPIIIGIPN
jgi:dTDP-6-deoxy-L-talose 4-dehydrogenase (NAD+)